MTEEQLKMFGLDGEVDPEVQQEMDMIKALNIAHWSETGTATSPDNEDADLELYAKKIKEAEAIMALNRDFSEEDIQTGTNETGLPLDECALNNIEKFLNEEIERLRKYPMSNLDNVSFRGFTKYYPTKLTPGQTILEDVAKEYNAKQIRTYEIILKYVQTQRDFSDEF